MKPHFYRLRKEIRNSSETAESADCSSITCHLLAPANIRQPAPRAGLGQPFGFLRILIEQEALAQTSAIGGGVRVTAHASDNVAPFTQP